jgi:hypothetical protein
VGRNDIRKKGAKMFEKFSSKTCIISFILIFTTGFSPFSFTPVLAATEPDDGGSPRLERLLRSERTALTKQAERLERTAENVT